MADEKEQLEKQEKQPKPDKQPKQDKQAKKGKAPKEEQPKAEAVPAEPVEPAPRARLWDFYDQQVRGKLQQQFGFKNPDRKSTRLNSSHGYISYAVFCLKKKKKINTSTMNEVEI